MSKLQSRASDRPTPDSSCFRPLHSKIGPH